MKKSLSLILALAMILTLFAGCGTTAAPVPEPESIGEPDVTPTATPATLEGVVKEASLSEIVVTLADGTDLTLDTTGITDLDVQLGDTVQVEYTGTADSATATKVSVTEKVEIPTATITGIVIKIEDGLVSLLLFDNTEATLKTESVEEYGVEVGDVLTVEYVDDDSKDGVDVISVDVNKPKKTEKYTFTLDSDTADPSAAAQTGTPDASSSTGSASSSSSSGGSGAMWTPSGTVTIKRSIEEAYAWFRAVVDLGGTVTLDNLNTFVGGNDIYPYGTDLYKTYLDFFKNKWDGKSDWRSVSINSSGSNGGGNYRIDDDDSDYDYNYDDEEDVPADNSSSSGSSESKSQSGRAEGSGDVYEVIRLVNAERSKAGLPELEVDSELMAMAAVRAEETAVLRGHTRPDGRNFDSILTDFGWNVAQYYTAENIAYGQTTASKVVNDWMNSSGHKANILKSTVTKIGLAFYYDSDSEWGNYWVMIATS